MLYFSLALLSLGLTYLIRWYTRHKAILDTPNARSSHTIPTPRGGGLAIVLSFFWGLFALHEQIELSLFWALLSVTPIVVVSLLDDIYSLSATLRSLVHMASIVLGLYALGGVSSIDLVFMKLEGDWLNLLAFIAIFWIINLYNFLDGIDGYAGAQAITTGLGIFAIVSNPLGLVIVASTVGFLLFNWHRASIFMGDVGSTFLGFIFAMLLFWDTSQSNLLVWLILLSLFWFDATVTLYRRFRAKEKLTQGHRKHAYQRLVDSGYSHSRVVTLATLFNLFFLLLLLLEVAPWRVLLLNLLLMSLIYYSIERRNPF
jgi:Fuc2NAc and GlcNAc transferase